MCRAGKATEKDAGGCTAEERISLINTDTADMLVVSLETQQWTTYGLVRVLQTLVNGG